MSIEPNEVLVNSDERKRNLLFLVFRTFILVIAFSVAYIFGNFFPIITSENETTKLIEKPKLASDLGNITSPFSQNSVDLSALKEAISNQVEPRYVLLDDSEIVLVSLEEDGTDIQTGITEISSGSYSWGSGFSEPNNSPDFKKIAYIDNGSRLHIMTSDGTADTIISNDLKVQYISGWSPDSSKLIFRTHSESISELVFSDYLNYSQEKKVTFERSKLPPGFYLLDLENQNLAYLSVFEDAGFGSWIDNSRVLLELKYSGQKKFVVFDFDTYTVDTGIMSGGLERDFSTQYAFSENGKKWALTWHGGTNTTDSATIILADFPSVEGKELMKGNFAQFQGPIISHDGKHVAFRGYDFVNGPLYVYVYDGTSVKKVADGIPREWINNSQFIYLQTDPPFVTSPQSGTKLQKFDISTGKSVVLYEFSKEK